MQVRAGAEESGMEPAIFQADFLFVKLGGSVTLVRVAHGLYLYDAQNPDITFSALQYEHHPNPCAAYI